MKTGKPKKFAPPIDMNKVAKDMQKAASEEAPRIKALPKRFSPERGEYLLDTPPSKADDHF